jgi:hypothetical protein
MKKKETKAWQAFENHIDTAKLKYERMETNRESFPDVIAQNRQGAVILLENKHIDEWPKKPATCPLKDAFEPGQLPFLRNWCQWEGNAYVLLHVGEGQREVLLLPPQCPLDQMTAVDLHDYALALDRLSIITYLENHEK